MMTEEYCKEGEVLISRHASEPGGEGDSDDGTGEYQIELQGQQDGRFTSPDTAANNTGSPRQALCFVVTASVMASLGGVLFGYDIGIISGAILQLKGVFCLSCLDQELVISAMLMGAVVGSLLGGFMIDFFGRRVTIIGNSVVFLVGAVILGFAASFPVLVVGRILVGFAVSVSATGECIYISEIAPAKRRGLLVSLNELGITLGLLLAYLCNFLFINITDGWRWMFGLSAIPAVIQGLGMIFLPPSPRFLMLKKQEEKAESVLVKLRGTSRVSKELSTIRVSIASEKNQSCTDLCSSTDGMQGRMLVGVGLVFFQQFTGQPNVLYYAPTIFETVGFRSNSAATLATVGLGLIKVVTCVIALACVDKFGRRKLLITGSIMMGVSILTLGLVCQFEKTDQSPTCKDLSDCIPNNHWNLISMHNTSQAGVQLPLTLHTTVSALNHTQGSRGSPSSGGGSLVTQAASHAPTTIGYTVYNITGGTTPEKPSVPMVRKILGFVALMMYVAAYGFSFGPVVWLILSEIFPAAVKGRAIALATVFNWGTNLIVTFTFLDIMNALGVTWTFTVFSIICAMATVFIFSFVPETKGKSLEQVSADMKSRTLLTRMKQNWTSLPCCGPNSVVRIHSNYRRVNSDVSA